MKKLPFSSVILLLVFFASCNKAQLTNADRLTNADESVQTTGRTLTPETFPVTITYVDSGPDPEDVPTYFDDLVQWAAAYATPAQKPSLPKAYYFLTNIYPAKLKSATSNGAGNFSFNVVTNDTARYPFKPTIASVGSNVQNAKITSITDGSTYNAPTNLSAGNFSVYVYLTVSYSIASVLYTDAYTITGICTNTPPTALSQQILNNSNYLFSAWINPNNAP